MTYPHWLVLCLVCVSGGVFGQQLSPTALVTAGKTDRVADHSLSWTLGQLSDATLYTTDHLLTEGFQQPELLIFPVPPPPGGTVNAEAALLQCSLYPNPTSDAVVITVQQEASSPGLIRLLDAEGREIRRQTVDLQQFQGTWQVTELAAGQYYLQVATATGELLQTFRLIKH